MSLLVGSQPIGPTAGQCVRPYNATPREILKCISLVTDPPTKCALDDVRLLTRE